MLRETAEAVLRHVDFFLNDDNYEKEMAYLSPFSASVEKDMGMTIDSWVVELHGRLCSGLSGRVEREQDGVYHDAFYTRNVRSWENNDVSVFQLTVENDVFYVFTHIL